MKKKFISNVGSRTSNGYFVNNEFNRKPVLKLAQKIPFLFVISIIFSGFTSCATDNSYAIIKKLDEKQNLTAKRTVFFDVQIAPINISPITLLDGLIYFEKLKSVREQIEEIESEKTKFLTEHLTKTYNQTYNTIVVNESFPVRKKDLKLNYFTKPYESTKKQIKQICEEKNADYAVAIVGEVCTYNVGFFGTQASGSMHANIALFNKQGELVAAGELFGPQLNVRAKDLLAYNSVFDGSLAYFKASLKKLGGNSVLKDSYAKKSVESSQELL
ncbi:MAG: hypothetical protein LBG79_02395 [Spirochaetaceae bacterium]|jgi:hypothetical protein|nr:hypothetical protein [Spirochaetaceae bacterium]GMO20044.1 MAG: hypothetical protein Pg6A_06840 [Termitinemataceae bacterium]